MGKSDKVLHSSPEFFISEKRLKMLNFEGNWANFLA